MCLCVDVQDKRYLADVGYGDLFVKPLEIKEGKQNDGRNEFTIQRLNNVNFMLSMSSNKVNFQQKYTFNLTEVPIERFKDICLDKQINPGSYFVKNMVCTKPTTSGRVTLFNDKFIEKKADVRIEEPILNDDELRSKLRNTFGIVIKR
jgi:N-hydroxyarylamine O-acetyltransferase